jgi:hypothetical protein
VALYGKRERKRGKYNKITIEAIFEPCQKHAVGILKKTFIHFM